MRSPVFTVTVLVVIVVLAFVVLAFVVLLVPGVLGDFRSLLPVVIVFIVTGRSKLRVTAAGNEHDHQSRDGDEK